MYVKKGWEGACRWWRLWIKHEGRVTQTAKNHIRIRAQIQHVTNSISKSNNVKWKCPNPAWDISADPGWPQGLRCQFHPLNQSTFSTAIKQLPALCYNCERVYFYNTSCRHSFPRHLPCVIPDRGRNLPPALTDMSTLLMYVTWLQMESIVFFKPVSDNTKFSMVCGTFTG